MDPEDRIKSWRIILDIISFLETDIAKDHTLGDISNTDILSHGSGGCRGPWRNPQGWLFLSIVRTWLTLMPGVSSIAQPEDDVLPSHFLPCQREYIIGPGSHPGHL